MPVILLPQTIQTDHCGSLSRQLRHPSLEVLHSITLCTTLRPLSIPPYRFGEGLVLCALSRNIIQLCSFNAARMQLVQVARRSHKEKQQALLVVTGVRQYILTILKMARLLLTVINVQFPLFHRLDLTAWSTKLRPISCLLTRDRSDWSHGHWGKCAHWTFVHSRLF